MIALAASWVKPKRSSRLAMTVRPAALPARDAGNRILHATAIARGQAQALQRVQVDLGVRFALVELLAAGNHLEKPTQAAIRKHLGDIAMRGR